MEELQVQIPDDDRLLRRVQFLHPDHIKEDGTPSSLAFSLRKGENGLSVDIERLTTYAQSIQDRKRFRLYALNVRTVRTIGLDCQRDPLEENPAHALILSPISRGNARKLAQASERIAYPD
ncbi:MAG: hypothetical protein K9J06_10180 [Flavobacteriales bacterium]|nr:hypothetical protein [Flavobacteriales bacterium]